MGEHKGKVLLILLLITNVSNVWSKPMDSTRYDKKQDIKIDKNTRDIDKETDQRRRKDAELNNSISNNSRKIGSLNDR